MFIIALLIVICLAVAAVMIPKKAAASPGTPQASMMFSPFVESPRRSLRRQTLEEEAAALADEYTAKADAAWRAELRAKAINMFEPPQP